MDKQLACATFATVIPVLLLAGLLSGELDDLLSVRRGRIAACVALSAALFGEMCALIGVTNPTGWLVGASATAAGIGVGGLGAAIIARIDTAAYRARVAIARQREERPRDSDGGQDTVND